nr:hypothetical protein GCM10020063_092140 [Dactylosporangium thailandense]
MGDAAEVIATTPRWSNCGGTSNRTARAWGAVALCRVRRVDACWAGDVWRTRQPQVLGRPAERIPAATPHVSIRAPIDLRRPVAGCDREQLHSGRTIHWISGVIGPPGVLLRSRCTEPMCEHPIFVLNAPAAGQ